MQELSRVGNRQARMWALRAEVSGPLGGRDVGPPLQIPWGMGAGGCPQQAGSSLLGQVCAWY